MTASTDATSSSQGFIHRGSHVKPGDIVLLRLPSEEVRSFKLDPKAQINFGKYGSFEGRELVGKPYGFTYEIVNGKLVIQEPKHIEELEDTDANNERIVDGAVVQPLTATEIEVLKTSGAHVSDIIKAQIEQHANYELKTEYSKDKYKKRKEAKFSKQFALIEPTLFNVCDYWFTKDASRVRDIRADTLGQIVNHANVRPGARFIVVDDAGGLIVAAILDRLGGEGRVLVISDCSQAPAYPVLGPMNFSKQDTEPLNTYLNWAHIEEDWAPLKDPTEPDLDPKTPDDDPKKGALRAERDNQRVQRKKETYLSLQAAREELFLGEWDGLIVASQYEPYSIVEKLSLYLGGSATIAIHSPYLHILTQTQSQMKAAGQYLAPSITEPWLRQYQILPGRTHPTMTTSGTGGFILHSIKIFDNRLATSTVGSERRLQRQKNAEHKRKKRAAEEAKLAAEKEQLAGKGSIRVDVEGGSVPAP